MARVATCNTVAQFEEFDDASSLQCLERLLQYPRLLSHNHAELSCQLLSPVIVSVQQISVASGRQCIEIYIQCAWKSLRTNTYLKNGRSFAGAFWSRKMPAENIKTGQRMSVSSEPPVQTILWTGIVIWSVKSCTSHTWIPNGTTNLRTKHRIFGPWMYGPQIRSQHDLNGFTYWTTITHCIFASKDHKWWAKSLKQRCCATGHFPFQILIVPKLLTKSFFGVPTPESSMANVELILTFSSMWTTFGRVEHALHRESL